LVFFSFSLILGIEYLKAVIGPVLQKFVSVQHNFNLQPWIVYKEVVPNSAGREVTKEVSLKISSHYHYISLIPLEITHFHYLILLFLLSLFDCNSNVFSFLD
jgi:hypothetical protein